MPDEKKEKEVVIQDVKDIEEIKEKKKRIKDAEIELAEIRGMKYGQALSDSQWEAKLKAINETKKEPETKQEPETKKENEHAGRIRHTRIFRNKS